MKLPLWLVRLSSKGLTAPLVVVVILGLMVLPVPAFVLDIFFSFNIALSIIVLLTALYTVRPLDFMVFPAVLLLTTMLRLSLNVASTRVVLTAGHTGPDAAGKVIEAFGHFLIGGNYLVGVVVFIILTIINFVVVTKGAGRIAEVGARFALDAMPGKQMAIDADLNAGLIGEADARKRRTEVAQEAEFYGAMDGASKYVRGDAVAGIVITVVNMVGGLLVGMLQHNLAFGTAIETYTLLAIGDGLVAQIPSLMISMAAGAVVSRVASEQDIGEQFVAQLLMKSQVLYITAGIIGAMGLIPGMPNLSFGVLALLIGTTAYLRARRASAPAAVTTAELESLDSAGGEDASWQDLAPVQVLSLEVGYRLFCLVDPSQDGDLLRRIKGVREQFAQEVGFLPPAVHISDNLELPPTAYSIALKGGEIGRGESHPGQFLAIDPGIAVGTLVGTQVIDPAFGLPATWIDAAQREEAQSMGYTVVDASTVVATHLNQLMSVHAAELLSRRELQALLGFLATDSPKLIEDLVPKLLPMSVLQKVLQNLLLEGVHIRDMRSIIDTLGEHAAQTQDAASLTVVVRIALGRAILQQIAPGTKEVPVMALDNQFERLLLQALQTTGPEGSGIEPGLADSLISHTSQAMRLQEQMGYTPLLLVSAALRVMLSRFLRRSLPKLRVLSHAEMPESRTIKVTNLVGAIG